MPDDRTRAALRALVRSFPALKIALAIHDFICLLVKKLLNAIFTLFKYIFNVVYSITKQAFEQLVDWLQLIPIFRQATANWTKPIHKYERIEAPKQHEEPIPYRDNALKRSITHQGGLVLGALLYVFVYFVLIKHHTYTIVASSLVLFLVYLIMLENSHNIRSIVMLCLPIMFTNRGRALVFCCMLTLLVAGPIRNTQANVKELHSSLTCCRQYLLLKSDNILENNIVQNVMQLETIINKLVDNIKAIAQEIKAKVDTVIEMALLVEDHLARAIQKLKEIVDVCNGHTEDLLAGCYRSFGRAYHDCKTSRYSFIFGAFCQFLVPLKRVCETLTLPDFLCSLPSVVVNFIDQTVGQRLKHLVKSIGEELYVEIDIEHHYSFNGTKSKSFKKVAKEISFDVEQKFWYVHFISRAFRLVSLVLVVWILATATLYHMHYLTELHYDNMYLDEMLDEVERHRSGRRGRRLRKTYDEQERTVRSLMSDEDLRTVSKSHDLIDLGPDEKEEDNDDEDQIPIALKRDLNNNSIQKEGEEDLMDPILIEGKEASKEPLLPLTKAHEGHYLKPLSFCMNKMEIQKVKISGIVWLVIVGYISFFVLIDYVLYNLIELVCNILREILFTSDLPLVDVHSKTANQVVHYNRTYINSLRKSRSKPSNPPESSGPVTSFYRRIMDSIEGDIPDDITILDSLEGCLPRATRPPFNTYKTLLYLALFTFVAVIVEAYALRTRHCIANLYYPRRARQRAVWLYRKLRLEKRKYLDDEKENAIKNNDKITKKPIGELSRGEARARALELGVKLLIEKTRRPKK